MNGIKSAKGMLMEKENCVRTLPPTTKPETREKQLFVLFIAAETRSDDTAEMGVTESA
jgi:hypothetical protein